MNVPLTFYIYVFSESKEKKSQIVPTEFLGVSPDIKIYNKFEEWLYNKANLALLAISKFRHT